MYAETCRKRAMAASRKKKGGKGCRVNGTGFMRIVTDHELLAELDRMDEEEEAKRVKAARREAREAKGAALAWHKAFMQARRRAWEAAKLEHDKLVVQWEEDCRSGTKPKRPKQHEVYYALGLDVEDD
jgi:hypothetical protein